MTEYQQKLLKDLQKTLVKISLECEHNETFNSEIIDLEIFQRDVKEIICDI